MGDVEEIDDLPDRGIEEMLNTLVWPGPLEEGIVIAGTVRQLEESEDRFHPGLSPSATGRASFSASVAYLLIALGIGAGVLLLIALLV